MKFEIDIATLKNMITRASVIQNKMFNGVKIEAEEDGEIYVTSGDGYSYVKISSDATVYNSGKAVVSQDDIKKIISTMSGIVCVEINNNILTVKNDKKKNMIRAASDEPFFSLPNNEFQTAFIAKENDIVETLASLDSIRSQNPNDPKVCLTGFNIDASKNRCVACDGYRFAIKNLKWKFEDENLNIIVPGIVAKHLEKIANIKSGNDIKVSVGKLATCSYISFSGSDFKYTARLIDGNYLDIDRVTPSDSDYEFEIDVDEFRNVIKDHLKLKVAKEDSTVVLLCEENSINIATLNSRFKSVDRLEKSEIIKLDSSLMMLCFIGYLKDMTDIMQSTKIKAYGLNRKSSTGCALSGMMFENEDYKVYILPVSPKDSRDVYAIRNFMLGA